MEMAGLRAEVGSRWVVRGEWGCLVESGAVVIMGLLVDEGQWGHCMHILSI